MPRITNWRKNGELRWEHTERADFITIDQIGRFEPANEGKWRVQAGSGFGGGVQRRTFDTKREAKEFASNLARNHPNGL